MTAKYIIGIDFGTTNCTMAYVSLTQEEAQIEQFAIPQIVSAGIQDVLPTLPSFLYFPLPEELKAKVSAIEWDPKCSYTIGHFARERGAELPLRLIASAKSWLCHAGIDRRKNFLPLHEEVDELKKSPLEACSNILRHLRQAWDATLKDAPFAEQQVYITVPASFDPSARQLVQEAAELAGFPEVILLEEPQAAFYAWIHAVGEEWRKQLKVGDSVLVVDIGGGTTDFSVVSVADEGGNLELQRTAVGSHLLLGGDNIDLSLAYFAKEKLAQEGHEIDEWQLQALVHSCRQIKESLLGDEPPQSADVVVMGRGSKLIGNSLKVTIARDELANVCVEGFMPMVQHHDQAKTEKRYAIQQVGLPYAQDPRITSQLAKFLSQTGEADSGSTERFIMPTAVLFNGGTTKAKAFRDRLLELLNQWAKKLDCPSVRELSHADYDFAVSRGAVYYGLARRGKALRIKSGTSRSYFVGVEDAAPAVPGIPKPLQAICVAPFGMEEGSELALADREFALWLGEPATFRFFSHATPKLSDGTEPVMGSVVKRWQQELTELHPIETELDKAEGDSKTVNVHLKAKVTELGMLELWCEAPDGRRWKLEFDIRKS